MPFKSGGKNPHSIPMALPECDRIHACVSGASRCVFVDACAIASKFQHICVCVCDNCKCVRACVCDCVREKKCRGHSLQTDRIQRAESFKKRQHWGQLGLNCVCAKQAAVIKGERKEFLKCICRVFLEEERILGEIKRKWSTQADREEGSLLTNQRVIRESWTGRQERRERAGHIEVEHWPRAVLRAALFSPFLQESQGGGKKKKGDKKEQKPTFYLYLWERCCQRCPI